MTEKNRQQPLQIDTSCPSSKEAWREWLQEHHLTKQSVWLICYKQQSGVPTLSWSEAVDEALCFGWIDSTRKPLDDRSFMQFFGKRKPSGTWSKINKDKIEKLLAEGRMAQAGLDIIEKAKQNGSWNILDTVEALLIPEDLNAAFADFPGSKDYFESLGKSMKKRMLQWIVLAKQDVTRQKRIQEIAEHSGRQTKPKQFT